jgi:hypothetical protein
VDALIIDGVQALDGHARAQDEMLQLFDVLGTGNRQVVLTSDRPLNAYVALAERLRVVFERGVAVTMVAPTAADRSGRSTPVAEGDEAAAPNIDASLDTAFVPDDPMPLEPAEPDVAAVTGGGRMLDSFFFDSEKVAAEWPEAAGRLLEDLV